ncbi:MAG: serine/threonine-protein kinase [Gemmataceae bacterium]
MLELLARCAQVECGQLARVVGPTDPLTVIDTLVERGIVDRVGARALSLAVDGQLDERDLRQFIDASAVQWQLNRTVLPTQGAPLPLSLHTTLGRYTIRGVLGRGRGGDVYRSVHPQFGIPVALKVSANGTALRAEATALASIVHRNVVRLWDLEKVGDLTVLVTEAGGESLARVLSRRKQLPLRRVFGIARGILAGLVAVHRAGLLHCDVKPSNILIGRGAPARLCDFGSARRIGSPASNLLEGTWAYAAPECFEGQNSPKSDVYSLGLTLHHALTGQPPVTTVDFEHCRAAHQSLQLDPLHWTVRGLTRSASNLLRRMVARDPENRPTASETLTVARHAFELDDVIEN